MKIKSPLDTIVGVIKRIDKFVYTIKIWDNTNFVYHPKMEA